MAGFSTSKGTVVHYNLTGWSKGADEVVTKFADVLSFNGLELTSEAMKEVDLETDTEVSAIAKTTCGDFEIVFRVPSNDKDTLKQWFKTQEAKTDITIKAHLPFGLGFDFLANVNVSKVSAKIESGSFLHIAITFAVSGLPTVI